jgi:hypothetical protein
MLADVTYTLGDVQRDLNVSIGILALSYFSPNRYCYRQMQY